MATFSSMEKVIREIEFELLQHIGGFCVYRRFFATGRLAYDS